jgi:hypothetical protein
LEFNFNKFSKDYLYTYQHGIRVPTNWEYLAKRKIKDRGYAIDKNEITLEMEKFRDIDTSEYMKSFPWQSRNRTSLRYNHYCCFDVLEFDIWDITVIEVLDYWRNKPNSPLNSTHEEVDFSKKNDFGQDWNSLANSGSDKD